MHDNRANVATVPPVEQLHHKRLGKVNLTYELSANLDDKEM